MKLYWEGKFDAAHFLPNYIGKCHDLHGHSFRVLVTISAEKQSDGMILDFNKIKKIVDNLDHKQVNDIVENPTAENIVDYLLEELSKTMKERTKQLFKIAVKVFETEKNSIEDEKTDNLPSYNFSGTTTNNNMNYWKDIKIKVAKVL